MSFTEYVSNDFLKSDFPEEMNQLGRFVYYRTYSRFLPTKNRRETWKETVIRATNYNVGLEEKHFKKLGIPVNQEWLKKEAELLAHNMFHIKQFLSGRTLWVGGADTGVAEKYPLANYNCFSRDTEFLTDKGLKSFNEFKDGDKVRVLTSTGGWREATVRSFGEEEIIELVVQRGRRTKTIKTTGNHRWFVRKSKGENKYVEKTTLELKQGDVLRTKKRYDHTSIVPCSIGIQHGIVFGDGTFDKKKNHCRVVLVGDKKELADLFTTGSKCTAGKADQLIVYGLPNNWKQLPSTDMNVEYLMGFLMGLFAADGSNCNGQHTISSSDREVLEFVRKVAPLVGIQTGDIRLSRAYSPYNGEYAPLYSINLNAEDITKDFLLRSEHIRNYSPCNKKLSWTVKEVRKTGVKEEVWCVQEPDTESFTLADGILTRNCSFINIRSWKDLGDLFYLLLVGTGVGFKCTKKFARELPPIRTNVKVTHKPYEPKNRLDRLERTRLTISHDGSALLEVGDSKEGWVESLNYFFEVLTKQKYEHIHTITIDYDSVRPKGERLKTFGGTASGPEPLRDMFEGFVKVLTNKIDPSLAPIEVVYEGQDYNGYKPVYGQVRPIHILDMGNLVGANVVVGGKQI